jgi:hypothetical protein
MLEALSTAPRKMVIIRSELDRTDPVVIQLNDEGQEREGREVTPG